MLAAVLMSGAAGAVSIDECRDLKDVDVRAKIQEITSEAIQSQAGAIDYKFMVEMHWSRTRMSQRTDELIGAAVAAVRADTTWLERAYSTVSRQRAEKFAIAVAEHAFNSEAFKASLAELTLAIGHDIGSRIESGAETIAGPVISCVQKALQARYGDAIAQVFAQETQKNIDPTDAGAAKIKTGDIAVEHAATISGIILIVTRRVIGRMVASLGRRVAGLIASRIVSTFTGFIGLALIVVDVYEAGQGIFPLVAERMKSDESKTLMREEIAKTLQQEIMLQTASIAQETAERIYSFWLDFKQKYNKLLDLSGKNARFAAFLKERKLEQLGKLGQIIDILLKKEGEGGIFQRTADGSLHRALLDLTDAGMVIATDQQSIDVALQWAKLAGPQLDRVVKYEVYKWTQPGTFTGEQLRKLLAIDDKPAITRLARLGQEPREFLLALPADRLRDLARRFTENELHAFADYQRRLPPLAAKRVLRAISEDPRAMRTLAEPSIRNAIFDSKDLGAAVEMLLRPTSFLNVWRMAEDFTLVRDGQVSYPIFLHQYWISLIAGTVLLLIILLLLRRLIFGRPRTIVVRENSGTRQRG